ncbi:hypothetical protein H2198_004366 [Neophaeococcomyces mojaviensis]|uniref:Uncharacterized protein n=1 Tax=Neophaeococcomyces mojaviensis TaxID=3383035 RepID=A0ACC3A8R6_9EURO|nr:hypothetical protein H2198_004366 [Knufia sp. JES_112]
MTDWEKLKVQDLKEECKSRRITITGLKLKQQFIDKLVEYESNSQDEGTAEASAEDQADGTVTGTADRVMEEVEQDDTLEQSQAHLDKQEHDQPETPERDAEVPLVVETDKNLPRDRPAALKVEDGQAFAAANREENEPVAETEQEARELQKEDMLIPQPEQLEPARIDQNAAEAKEHNEDVTMDDAEATLKTRQEEAKEEPVQIVDRMRDNSQVTESDQNEDSRKRKRRSVTPPPDAEEIRKRAKAINGEAIVSKNRAISPSPEAQNGTVTNSPAKSIAEEKQSEESHVPQASQVEDHGEEVMTETQRTSRSPSVDKDSIVAPALHAATRSLYMRNFKRPLNIQTLRSHISTVAQGSSSVPPGENPVKFWHMNNIRSHAFVTFSSISAASRVRTAMHDTRFPNEPQREHLWVDFVPDDKVEEWVEQETGAGSRVLGRNSGIRFEVVYSETDDGLQAVFQQVDPSSLQSQRPSISAVANNRSSISQRQASYTADPSKTATIASDVHSDRANIVPQSPSTDRHRQSPLPGPAQPKQLSDQGTGFKALDELFSSTTTKPKLYFKLQSQDVIDDRLEMIKDLYSDRGVTGDPGMKRYTFEKDRGREIWVDNGPEFGHGKKGQERLAGVGGRGRGGYRGRGGGGRFYGGDSYRGGGRR